MNLRARRRAADYARYSDFQSDVTNRQKNASSAPLSSAAISTASSALISTSNAGSATVPATSPAQRMGSGAQRAHFDFTFAQVDGEHRASSAPEEIRVV
ncbi:hypothetical protein [Nitrogeniibacter aestuarii]|uniref:hypothetical protein n=1 Tax=Nitrogeniibacter aestuarii TaxID=2815343 RepID=UPI001E4C5413|nr:hypothetical protein [Nitrogeniibacter aestuarii]